MTIDSCHGLMARPVSGAVWCLVYLLRLEPGVPSYKRKKAMILLLGIMAVLCPCYGAL